jgi:hypothetical protein
MNAGLRIERLPEVRHTLRLARRVDSSGVSR